MAYQGHPDQYFGHISYAQHGDDLMIANLFKLLGVDRPSYLDLGAHHPTIISNTRLLYERGSRGVNVEANPYMIDAFVRERPGDVNVNCAVGPVAGVAILHLFSASSGLNTLSRDEVAKLQDVLRVREELEVNVLTLNQIVDKYCDGDFPALLTCDVEGLDYAVLDGADFQKTAPLLVCVETRFAETKRMREMMGRQGYMLHCRMGENLIFVQEKFRWALFEGSK